MNQLLEQSDTEVSDPASTNNPSSITPWSLDDATQEALIRLDSLTHELRLHNMVRISTKDDALPESAFPVKGQDDDTEGVPTENQFRHRYIRVATNVIELKDACRLLQASESTNGAPTHFMLRLCHETYLDPAALDQILTLISEHTVGTSQLSFLIPDSVQVRESITCHRLTHALRSICCHIVIENYNPARSNSEAIQALHASEIISEANFRERAAQNEPWATVLP